MKVRIHFEGAVEVEVAARSEEDDDFDEQVAQAWASLPWQELSDAAEAIEVEALDGCQETECICHDPNIRSLEPTCGHCGCRHEVSS